MLQAAIIENEQSIRLIGVDRNIFPKEDHRFDDRPEPLIRMRTDDRRVGHTVLPSDKYMKERSVKESNHRKHSRRQMRRAPKRALLAKQCSVTFN